MMTPEPDGGFYKDADVASFIRKFGYADKKGRADRMNFGGRHVVGERCPPTGLTLQLVGFNAATGKITDANGKIALMSDADEVAASWSFKKILEHTLRWATSAQARAGGLCAVETPDGTELAIRLRSQGAAGARHGFAAVVAGVRNRCSLLRSGHQAGKRVHGQSKVQEAQPVSRGV